MKQRRVFIRDWNVKVRTGIHAHEKSTPQPLRLNITLYQNDTPARKIGDVACYSTHRARMLETLQARHYPLLEMLADALVKAAFHDKKVRRVAIEIEKLALYKDVESCGIAIDRAR